MRTEAETEHKNTGEKTVLETIVSKIVSFHIAGYTGNAAFTAASKDTIATEEILRNQAIIESFYGGTLVLLFFGSLLVDYLSGRIERVGMTETCRAHVAGKKLDVFVSAPFSLVGAALLFSEYPKPANERNLYAMGFAFLFMSFSGYLSGGTTPSIPASVSRFFRSDVTNNSGRTPELMREPFEQRVDAPSDAPVVVAVPSAAAEPVRP